MLGGPLLEAFGPAPRLCEPVLETGEFTDAVEGAAGAGVGGLGCGETAVGDGEALPGGAAGDGGGAEHGLGQAGVARGQLGQLHGVACLLLHTVGVGEQGRVTLAHPGLGGAAAFGEPLLHIGEALGVEEPPEEPAPGLGVGAQEAGEVALGQQHHLAELLAAHAEQLLELGADLLVGAAEVLPGARPGVVLAQPGLGLVDGGALAA